MKPTQEKTMEELKAKIENMVEKEFYFLDSPEAMVDAFEYGKIHSTVEKIVLALLASSQEKLQKEYEMREAVIKAAERSTCDQNLLLAQDSFRRKVEGLIGEDDKFNYQDIEELSEIKGRNQLRAEQRAKLKNIK